MADQQQAQQAKQAQPTPRDKMIAAEKEYLQKVEQEKKEMQAMKQNYKQVKQAQKEANAETQAAQMNAPIPFSKAMELVNDEIYANKQALAATFGYVGSSLAYAGRSFVNGIKYAGVSTGLSFMQGVNLMTSPLALIGMGVSGIVGSSMAVLFNDNFVEGGDNQASASGQGNNSDSGTSGDNNQASNGEPVMPYNEGQGPYVTQTKEIMTAREDERAAETSKEALATSEAELYHMSDSSTITFDKNEKDVTANVAPPPIEGADHILKTAVTNMDDPQTGSAGTIPYQPSSSPHQAQEGYSYDLP